MLLTRRDKVYSLFDELFGNSFFNNTSTAIQHMKTDVEEREGNYVLSIELPGFNKDDIAIELIDGYLSISAKRETSDEEKDEQGRFIKRERAYGSVSRSFYIGTALNKEDIKAAYKDGILTLTVPKEAPKAIEEKKLIAIE